MSCHEKQRDISRRKGVGREGEGTLIQSLWLETSLAERPISFTPRLSNSPWLTEAAPSSVVQTAENGVEEQV